MTTDIFYHTGTGNSLRAARSRATTRQVQVPAWPGRTSVAAIFCLGMETCQFREKKRTLNESSAGAS